MGSIPKPVSDVFVFQTPEISETIIKLPDQIAPQVTVDVLGFFSIGSFH